jgi:hypothetical protein
MCQESRGLQMTNTVTPSYGRSPPVALTLCGDLPCGCERSSRGIRVQDNVACAHEASVLKATRGR